MKLFPKMVAGVIILGGGIVALPSLFNKPQPACACGSEGKSYIGAMMRAQQAELLGNGKFATSIEALGVIQSSETKSYRYSMTAQKNRVTIYGQSKNPKKHGYVGGVFITPGAVIKDAEPRPAAIICMTEVPSTASPPAPIDAQTCAAGTKKFDF